MIPEEFDIIKRLRAFIQREQNDVKEGAAKGGPLDTVDETHPDPQWALVQYARMVGGYQAYQHVLDQLELMLERREAAFGEGGD